MPIPGAIALTIGAGQATGAGNTLLVSPHPDRRLRLHYVSYNPKAAAEVGFRFGEAGLIWLRNDLIAPMSVIAKDLGDFRFLEGGVGEALYVNQNNAVTTNWTVFYTEIP